MSHPHPTPPKSPRRPRPAQAAHAVALPAEPAEWVQLLPAGTFTGRDGRGPYVNDDPAGILAAFGAWGMPLNVDYEHQSLGAAGKTGPTPAAGWVQALDVRDGEIWGQMDWCAPAAELLSTRQYRYLSPVFDYEPDSGRVLRLIGAGLTNNPNLYLTAAASRTGGALVDELIESICYRLNIPLTSTPEEIAMHLQRLIDMLGATKTATAEMARALGLPADAELSAVAQAVQARSTGQAVPRAEFDRVVQALEALRAERLAEQVTAAVDAAVTAGKLAPAQRDWATAYATRDLAGFRDYVKAAPVVVTGDSHARGTPPTAGDAQAARGVPVPAGEHTDTTRTALHNRALDYQRQHPGADYLTAVRAVEHEA